MPKFKKTGQVIQKFLLVFFKLGEMEFDKEYFPSGLERSRRINKMERRKYENTLGEGLLLAGEKKCSV